MGVATSTTTFPRRLRGAYGGWIRSLLLAFAAFAIVSPAGDANPDDRLRATELPNAEPAVGRFLIASKKLGSPYFRHSVVLLIKHDKEGTIGIVVNQPTLLSLSSMSPKLLHGDDTDALYYGGPVQHMLFSMLVGSDSEGLDRAYVLDHVYHVAGVRDIMSLIPKLGNDDTVRVYAGYAGWGPGQLDNEIARGGWHVAPGDPAVIFSAEPEKIWKHLIDEFGGYWL
jgi:putative transcriptional regulator